MATPMMPKKNTAISRTILMPVSEKKPITAPAMRRIMNTISHQMLN